MHDFVFFFVCLCCCGIGLDVSDETKRTEYEGKQVKSTLGYNQRVMTKIEISPDGQYLALLFDRYCVIRAKSSNFAIEFSCQIVCGIFYCHLLFACHIVLFFFFVFCVLYL